MLSRRTMFGASAAAIIASVPVVSVAAPAADAGILALADQYEVVHAEYQEACNRASATFDGYKATRPSPPDALIVTRLDGFDFGWLSSEIGKPMSPYGYDRLDQWLGSPAFRNSAASARLEPRARELLKAYDDHEAADQAAVAQHKAASEAEDAVYDRVCDLERKIMAAPCSTLAGLKVKALVAQRNRPPSDHEHGSYSEFAAQSVVDILLNGGLN